MIHAAYPNACASHLKNGATSSSWGVKSKQLELVPLAYISCSSRMKDSEHRQRIKPEQGYDTLTTTTITKVESTLDKLEARAVDAEAGRDNQA